MMVMNRPHGFPLDILECGWLLTAYDVATIDTILAGDKAAEFTMMAGFTSMARVITRDVMAASTPYVAATIHSKLLWVQLREGAFQRAV